MNPSLPEALCTQCALCCDGSLFADVELLGQAEVVRLEIMGLKIIDDDTEIGTLSQPCAALVGRRCGIYEHRPKCCRTFECQLLLDVDSGAVTVERAQQYIAETQQQIRRVRELLKQVNQRDVRLPLKERCTHALSAAQGATPELAQKHTELEAAMTDVEDSIWKHFLGNGKARPRSDRR